MLVRLFRFSFCIFTLNLWFSFFGLVSEFYAEFLVQFFQLTFWIFNQNPLICISVFQWTLIVIIIVFNILLFWGKLSANVSWLGVSWGFGGPNVSIKDRTSKYKTNIKVCLKPQLRQTAVGRRQNLLLYWFFFLNSQFFNGILTFFKLFNFKIFATFKFLQFGFSFSENFSATLKFQ